MLAYMFPVSKVNAQLSPQYSPQTDTNHWSSTVHIA